MEGKIFLRQVLLEMEKLDNKGNLIPFTLECRTFNSNNKSGGRYRIYKVSKLLAAQKMKGKVFNPMEHEFRQFRVRRNPHHWDNRTRNLELKNGAIRKIKILYIIKFNGLEVLY